MRFPDLRAELHISCTPPVGTTLIQRESLSILHSADMRHGPPLAFQLRFTSERPVPREPGSTGLRRRFPRLQAQPFYRPASVRRRTQRPGLQ